MSPGRRDIVVIVLAVAGLLGAISLAGIFVVYLIDTVGGNDSSGPAIAVRPTTPTVAAPTGPSGTTGPTATKPGSPSPAPTSPQASPSRPNRIPNNQLYVPFRNRAAGYSILSPKGWTKTGTNKDISFSFERNFVHVIIANGVSPTVSGLREVVAGNKQLEIVNAPRAIRLNGAPAVKATVHQLGVTQPNGHPVRVLIDQYRFSKSQRGTGPVCAIDFGTAGAVYKANADDFQKVLRSFRWL
jgi:hypothetical protein